MNESDSGFRRHAQALAPVSETASFARLSCKTAETGDATMSVDTKTPFEHVNDVLAQLKEIRHYAKNNVETLTAQWLLFDGELKKLKQTESIETLMTRQSELHDALNEEIAALEELAITLQPPAEDA
jgi:citrate synthase